MKVTSALASIDEIAELPEEPGNVEDNPDEDQTDNNDDLDEHTVFRFVEKKPPVQLGLNGKNLDHVYSGHKPSEYGLALRKWIYGVDGLAYEMILPTKSLTDGRKCASKESLLKFFPELENFLFLKDV